MKLELDPHILGAKPANDGPYSLDAGVIARVSEQYGCIANHSDLPADLQERYNSFSSTLGSREAVECSLVNQAAGAYPGFSCGHVIRIPNFGTINLAKLTVTHEDFKDGTNIPEKTTIRLTMLDLELGCAISAAWESERGRRTGTRIHNRRVSLSRWDTTRLRESPFRSNACAMEMGHTGPVRNCLVACADQRHAPGWHSGGVCLRNASFPARISWNKVSEKPNLESSGFKMQIQVGQRDSNFSKQSPCYSAACTPSAFDCLLGFSRAKLTRNRFSENWPLRRLLSLT